MITIDKIISDKLSEDGREVRVLLISGTDRRLCPLSGLPDNNNLAREAILARAEELFKTGRHWDDSPSNIVCYDSIIKGKDYGKMKSDAALSNSVPELRAIVEELVEVVEALKYKAM